MKKNLLLFSLVFIVHVSYAQDDSFTKLKNAADKSAVQKEQLSAVKITRSDPRWRAIVKPAIPFKPFELKDKTGKPISPTEPVTLTGGATITAAEFITRLNDIEKKLNAQGFTLKTDEPVVVSTTTPKEEYLSGKIAQAPRSIAPLKQGKILKDFMNPEKRSGNLILKPFALYSAKEKQDLDQYDFAEANGGVTTKKMVRVKGGPIGSVVKNVKLLKTIDVTNNKSWEFGDPDWFAAGIEGTIHRYAKIYTFDPAHLDKSMSEFKVTANGKAWGSVYGHSLDLLTASAELYAPADTSKNMTANIKIQSVGITLFNLSKSYKQYIDMSDTYGKHFDKSFPISIPIGLGFDFTGKIGIKGTTGFDYGGSLYRGFAAVHGTPTINIEGYAEAGIDFLSVIGGGVGGKLTVLKADLELSAFAGIYSQNAEQIVAAVSYYFGYNLDILSGSLYCYVEACIPWVHCWRPVEHEFFNWSGFKDSGTIAEGSESIVIANLSESGPVFRQ